MGGSLLEKRHNTVSASLVLVISFLKTGLTVFIGARPFHYAFVFGLPLIYSIALNSCYQDIEYKCY